VQPGDALAQTQAKPEPARARWYHTVLGLVVILALLGCVCGCGWLVLRHFVDRASSNAARAKTGDCLADSRGGHPLYRRVSCRDRTARYRVFAVADGRHSRPNPCVDVPGASRLYKIDFTIVCIGDKDADPARSANLAAPGDCLRVVRGADPERLTCTDPRANFTVLRRRTDVDISTMPMPGLPSNDPCADQPRTVTEYELNWEYEGPTPATPAPAPGLARHVDLLFCLARVHEPPPAVPDAPANCRFVTADGVLTALNAAQGQHHRSAQQTGVNSDGECQYQLIRDDGGADQVTIELTGDLGWPPPRISSDRQEFTLDGATAAWRAEKLGGGGYFAVQRPAGTFEIDFVFRGSSPSLREAAIQIYRAAAPHLP